MLWINAADTIEVLTLPHTSTERESTYSSKEKNSYESEIPFHKVSKLLSSIINF